MKITFPKFTGLRCLMMPYIQGEINSVPEEYISYKDIINSLFFQKGDIGYLTIDESPVKAGLPHRGDRAKHGRAIHTEAGLFRDQAVWGGGNWGGRANVKLDRDTRVLIASNLDDSCAVWNSEHLETSEDGDIGHVSHLYPYKDAKILKAGEVSNIGIFTPHESLPAKSDFKRQFLRIISSGVEGREPYFTINPLMQMQ